MIEEVEVWLEHVGEFEGNDGPFCDTTVRPKWTLQRINGGPGGSPRSSQSGRRIPCPI